MPERSIISHWCHLLDIDAPNRSLTPNDSFVICGSTALTNKACASSLPATVAAGGSPSSKTCSVTTPCARSESDWRATRPLRESCRRQPCETNSVTGCRQRRKSITKRDRRRLAAIEERGLESEGLSTQEAHERAWQIAAAIMENARSNTPAVDVTAARGEAEARAMQEKRARIKAMLADARSGRYRKQRDRHALLKFAFSGQTRLLAGCLLLALFAAQGHQTGIFDAFKNQDTGQVDLDRFGSAIRETATVAARDASNLDVETEGRASTWSLGIAGLLLAMSAFVSGWRMTPFAVVATLVILLGPSLGIPAAGPLPAWIVSVLTGLVIYVPGILFGESREA